MRPSGQLHLGNLVGALENWVELQKEFQNYHMVADWHVLTTKPEQTANIREDTLYMIMDWIAAGLDPEKSPMFIQSEVKQHAELHLLFSMLITVNRLERNPTVKEQAKELNLEDNMSYGHLGYPVLQAADILIYKAHYVPVGEDQVPHVEMTREIARKFNNAYDEVFPEPEVKLTKFSKLLGTDGRKMSKSYGNLIFLSDPPDDIRTKLKKAVTDPQKIRKGDPGRPDVCLVYNYHERFNSSATAEIEADCKSGALGCVDCKTRLTDKLVGFLEPFREKRAYFEQNRDELLDILEDGRKRATAVAEDTMARVYKAMKLG